jgi:hypothetical protein
VEWFDIDGTDLEFVCMGVALYGCLQSEGLIILSQELCFIVIALSGGMGKFCHYSTIIMYVMGVVVMYNALQYHTEVSMHIHK